MLQVAEHQSWFCYDILDFIGAHYIRMDYVGLDTLPEIHHKHVGGKQRLTIQGDGQ
jgi:hypothetical protein